MTRPQASSRNATGKGVAFSSNPILDLRLAVWRSRLLLFVLFIAFAAFVVRDLWLHSMSK